MRSDPQASLATGKSGSVMRVNGCPSDLCYSNMLGLQC